MPSGDPASLERLDEESYTDWQSENNVVYVAGDNDRLVIVAPSESAEGC